MGSSAALAVGTIRALHGINLPFTTVDELAFRVERVFHGNPSGIDHAVSALGGVLAYRRGEAPVSLELPRPLRLVVIDTGAPGDTAAMVAGVRARGRHDLLDAVGAVAERVIAGLASGADCGELFDENQRLLRALGVSTPALDAACAALGRAGARGAKLAGAGGGGVAFGVVDDVDRALAELRGFRAFAVSIYSRSQDPMPTHVMSQSGQS
jgi:mevalonate kinase